MPVGVVDALEIAEIEREQRKRISIAGGAVDLLTQILFKHATIVQARQ